jgi:hypothetical protein
MSSSYNFYDYSPSLPANVIFAIVMGGSLIVNTVQMFRYRSWWFGISFILGTSAEFIGYIARCLSHNNITELNVYLAQTITLVFAPVFLMAGIYYVFAILIVIYGPKYSLIKPVLCSWIFIVGDVVSLFVQAGGGAIIGSDHANAQVGINIALGGVAFQLAVMCIFMILFCYFLYRIHFLRDQSSLVFNEDTEELRSKKQVQYYPSVMLIVVTLIFIRSIYRLIEFKQGNDGPLVTHEVYFLVFDSLMISLSVLIFNVFHPGRILGPKIGVKGVAKRRSIDEDGKDEIEMVVRDV